MSFGYVETVCDHAERYSQSFWEKRNRCMLDSTTHLSWLETQKANRNGWHPTEGCVTKSKPSWTHYQNQCNQKKEAIALAADVSRTKQIIQPYIAGDIDVKTGHGKSLRASLITRSTDSTSRSTFLMTTVSAFPAPRNRSFHSLKDS